MNYSNEYILNKIRKKTKLVGECWIYTGGNARGHGYIRIGNKMCYVHRLSAYIHLNLDLNGPLQANHKIICPNKACWNPEHLYIGTQKDNVHDAIPNMIKKFCSKGHIKTGRVWSRDLGRYRTYCTICDNKRRKKERVTILSA